jgi:hypothetical protein
MISQGRIGLVVFLFLLMVRMAMMGTLEIRTGLDGYLDGTEAVVLVTSSFSQASLDSRRPTLMRRR